MSLKPGIGEEYYLTHKDEIWEKGYIQLENGKRARIPRYFEKQMEEEDPIRLWEIKKKRQQAAMSQTKNKMVRTDIPFGNYLTTQERRIEKQKRAKGVF